jgi:hypothetical protein
MTSPTRYGGPREGYVMMAAELQRLIEAAGPRIVAAGGRAGRQPAAGSRRIAQKKAGRAMHGPPRFFC